MIYQMDLDQPCKRKCNGLEKLWQKNNRWKMMRILLKIESSVSTSYPLEISKQMMRSMLILMTVDHSTLDLMTKLIKQIPRSNRSIKHKILQRITPQTVFQRKIQVKSVEDLTEKEKILQAEWIHGFGYLLLYLCYLSLEELSLWL